MRTVSGRSLLLILFVVSLNLSAQQVDSELDKKYTPNQNSPFNSQQNSRNSGSSSSSSEITFNNALKFTPTMFFRQRIYAAFEKKIGGPVSIYLGMGIDFGRDYLQYVFIQLADPESSSTSGKVNNVASLSDVISYSQRSGTSLMLSTGLKIYYNGHAFDGGFVEFNYRRESQDYLLSSNVSGRLVVGDNRATVNANTFLFGYGYAGTSGSRNKITHEFFMNFGLKFMSFTRFDAVTSQNNPNFTNLVRSTEELTATLYPVVNIGYSFGFGF